MSAAALAVPRRFVNYVPRGSGYRRWGLGASKPAAYSPSAQTAFIQSHPFTPSPQDAETQAGVAAQLAAFNAGYRGDFLPYEVWNTAYQSGGVPAAQAAAANWAKAQVAAGGAYSGSLSQEVAQNFAAMGLTPAQIAAEYAPGSMAAAIAAGAAPAPAGNYVPAPASTTSVPAAASSSPAAAPAQNAAPAVQLPTCNPGYAASLVGSQYQCLPTGSCPYLVDSYGNCCAADQSPDSTGCCLAGGCSASLLSSVPWWGWALLAVGGYFLVK